MMKLYYAPGSCALAPHIALEEAGAEFETHRVNFKEQEQSSPAYLAVNPKGRVPSLATDRGVLTEVPAILAFVAQNFPEAKLAPLDDAYAFAQVQAFNSYICSTVHIAHAHKMRGARWANEETSLEDMRRKVPETMGACFHLIESKMLRGPWVTGEAYSICDPYLFMVTRWMEGDGLRMADFPKIEDHFRRMSERPAVKRALAVQAA
ncbi:MAG TPA: glutathione S-transferase N-terminal domain-containing protein [Afipia sp.]